MKRTTVRKIIYGYLLFPVLIFVLGWMKAYVSVPVTLALLAAVYFIFRKEEASAERISWKVIGVAALFALAWCVLAGQGGLFYQSEDHNARNAIFRDLILRDWPVRYPEENMGMIYYVGHWMVPALFGKLLLPLAGEAVAWSVANIVLLCWTTLGITMVFLLLFQVVQAKSWKSLVLTAVIMIFFSGLDIGGIAMQCVTNRRLILIDHIECWGTVAEYSSLTTCLFWVYNQTVVPWIVTLLYLNREKKSNYAFLGIICTVYAPLPALGILPFMIGSALCDFVQAGKKEKKQWFFDVFTVQNLVAVLVLFPVIYLYYEGNYAWSESAIAYMDHSPWGTLKTVLVLVAFIILEFGIYAVLVAKQYYKERNYIIAVASLLGILLFQVGMGSDFTMRVSMPGLLVLMTLVTRVLLERKNRLQVVLLSAALCVGAVTPLVEYGRAIYQIISEKKIALVADEMKTLEDKEQIYVENFVTFELDQNIFFNTIGKE